MKKIFSKVSLFTLKTAYKFKLTRRIMEAIVKFLIANARGPLAKAVKGFMIGPMLAANPTLDITVVKAAVGKAMAVVRGETVTYVDMDEQHAVEGLVGLVGPIFQYYNLTLTEVELEPLVTEMVDLL